MILSFAENALRTYSCCSNDYTMDVPFKSRENRGKTGSWAVESTEREPVPWF